MQNQRGLCYVQRFPRWMWRNTETREFVQWMKERNDNIPLGDKPLRGLGIYGMDVRVSGQLQPINTSWPQQVACTAGWSTSAWCAELAMESKAAILKHRFRFALNGQPAGSHACQHPGRYTRCTPAWRRSSTSWRRSTRSVPRRPSSATPASTSPHPGGPVTDACCVVEQIPTHCKTKVYG